MSQPDAATLKKDMQWTEDMFHLVRSYPRDERWLTGVWEDDSHRTLFEESESFIHFKSKLCIQSLPSLRAILVRSILGVGGNGSVASIIMKGREYAMKVFKYARLNMDVVQREYRICRHVQHIFVAQPVGLYRLDQVCPREYESSIVMVQEKCEPIDAHRDAFTADHIKSIATMLAILLRHLRSKKVVHSDIKLENMCLASYDTYMIIKLVDFGHAFSPADPDHVCSMGTYHTAAPEVFRARRWSYPADMWSAGCALFQLCTGVAPYGYGTEQEMPHRHDTYDIDWSMIVDPDLRDLLQRMMHIDEEKRIQPESMLEHASISKMVVHYSFALQATRKRKQTT